jgi:hypothetical protein
METTEIKENRYSKNKKFKNYDRTKRHKNRATSPCKISRVGNGDSTKGFCCYCNPKLANYIYRRIDIRDGIKNCYKEEKEDEEKEDSNST